MADEKRKTEAPFVEWKPDAGLIQNQYIPEQETSIDEFSTGDKDVAYSYGSAGLPMAKDFDNTRKAIKRILNEDKNGK